jgi:hypothetical protein
LFETVYSPDAGWLSEYVTETVAEAPGGRSPTAHRHVPPAVSPATHGAPAVGARGIRSLDAYAVLVGMVLVTTAPEAVSVPRFAT